MKRVTDKWPSLLFLFLALIPLSMLIFIILNLVLTSRTAIDTLGLGNLFSINVGGSFSYQIQGQYGLVPALYGTFLIIIISMSIAVPVSLAMAIFSSEFTLGFLGKGMRTVLGILGGIPSVIYAMMSVLFAQIFIVPKFAGQGIPTNSLPIPITRLPFDNSTLLGGLMLSMFVIPFMAPLFDDAIRDVPYSLKEASLGLGASRWHTLWNVTFPQATSGIVSAATLGMLKAMGDVVIVGVVIGFASPLPNPLFDILKATPPLTSTGAGFLGGFQLYKKSPLNMSAASFSALLLLLIALACLTLVPVLQRRLKRRFAR